MADKIDFATITIGMSAAQTLTNANQIYTLNMNTIRNQDGNGFIHGANAVRIGAGVHKVLVSAQVYWFDKINASNQSTGSMCVQYIYKNENQVMIVNGRSAINYFVRSFATKLIYVDEGDIISVRVKNEHSAGSSIGPNEQNTYLTLVAIG